MLSRRCSGFAVAGIAQVTAGCETTNFKAAAPSCQQSSSPPKPATALLEARETARPRANGRFDDHGDAELPREREQAPLASRSATE